MRSLAILFALALTACTTTRDYSLCGVPYSDAEDAAGVEHSCPEGENR